MSTKTYFLIAASPSSQQQPQHSQNEASNQTEGVNEEAISSGLVTTRETSNVVTTGEVSETAILAAAAGSPPPSAASVASNSSLDESSQHEINEKTTQDKASSSTPASSIHDSSFEAVEAIDEEEITCDLTKIETLSDQEIVEDVAKDLREVSDALKPFTVFSDANKTTTTTTQPSTGSKQTTPEVVHRELCTGSKQRATNTSPCTSTDKGDEDDCDVED